jgi:hypothetical protein
MKDERTCFLYCCIGWLLLRCVLWTIPPIQGQSLLNLDCARTWGIFFYPGINLPAPSPMNCAIWRKSSLFTWTTTNSPVLRFVLCHVFNDLSMIILQLFWPTGPIPIELKQLKYLRDLGLSGNKLTPGTLPPLSYLVCVQHVGGDLPSHMSYPSYPSDRGTCSFVCRFDCVLFYPGPVFCFIILNTAWSLHHNPQPITSIPYNE